ADQGPRNVPKIPRAAIVARNNSDSNHSAARSAIAIGPHRNRRYRFSLPSPRTPLPVFKSAMRSEAFGDLIDGGVMLITPESTELIRVRTFWNSLNFSASFFESFAIDCADFSASS